MLKIQKEKITKKIEVVINARTEREIKSANSLFGNKKFTKKMFKSDISKIFSAHKEISISDRADILNAAKVKGEPLLCFLMRNAANGKKEYRKMASYTLSLGVNKNIQNDHGQTALHIAASDTAGNTKKLLSDLFSEENVSILDERLSTPIHIAIFHKNKNFVQAVADYGGELTEPDAHGRTPLTIAQLYAATEIEEIIKDRLANQITKSMKQAFDKKESNQESAQKIINTIIGKERPENQADILKLVEAKCTEYQQIIKIINERIYSQISDPDEERSGTTIATTHSNSQQSTTMSDTLSATSQLQSQEENVYEELPDSIIAPQRTFTMQHFS